MLALASCTAGDGTGLDAGGRPVPPGPPANNDFQQIQDTIFTPICSVCHQGANAPQGLRLDAGNSYALLVNVASAEVPGLMRVNPGNPDTSYLVQKIQGNAAVGVRMPANGPPYLTQVADRSGARLDRSRRTAEHGARRPAGRGQQHSRDLGAGATRVSASSPSSSTETSTVRSRTSTRFALRDANDQPVTLAGVRVPAGRPNVVEITMAQALAAGSYQLSVHGDGPAPLADQCRSRARRRCRRQAWWRHAHSLRCQIAEERTDDALEESHPTRRRSRAALAFAGAAQAEPYLAAQMGLKCVQCHVNPDRRWHAHRVRQHVCADPARGETHRRRGGLWTGQVMKFLSVGGNARANYNYTDVPNQDSTNDFAVEEARAYLDFGVIPNRLSVYIDQRFAPGNSTNLEANIRYWITENSIYVKAGPHVPAIRLPLRGRQRLRAPAVGHQHAGARRGRRVRIRERLLEHAVRDQQWNRRCARSRTTASSSRRVPSTSVRRGARA